MILSFVKKEKIEFVLSISFDNRIISRRIYSSLIFQCVVASYLLVPIIVLKLGSFRLFKLTYTFMNLFVPQSRQRRKLYDVLCTYRE